MSEVWIHSAYMASLLIILGWLHIGNCMLQFYSTTAHQWQTKVQMWETDGSQGMRDEGKKI